MKYEKHFFESENIKIKSSETEKYKIEFLVVKIRAVFFRPVVHRHDEIVDLAVVCVPQH